MADLDVNKLRQQTVGCQHVIHFNNAGAALMPDPVYSEMMSYAEAEREIGGYEVQENRQAEIESFYVNAAKLISAKPEEIAFTEGATKAWELAFNGIDWKKGDRIITGYAEYSSNYLSILRAQQRYGVEIDVIADDQFGRTSVEQVEKTICERTRLVSITHVPTSSGLINQVKEIGKIVSHSDALYFVDTCQSVGQIPVDVDEIECDMLCATGRKFLRGPRGTGFLFIKEELITQLEPMFIGVPAVSWNATNSFEYRSDARKFECFEKSYASLVGLSSAIKYHLSLGQDEIWRRIQNLAERLRNQLSEIPGVELLDPGIEKCAIVTFNCATHSAQEIKAKLKSQSINVAVAMAEYARLDMGHRNIEQAVRASIHYYNSEEEIDSFCNHLISLVS